MKKTIGLLWLLPALCALLFASAAQAEITIGSVDDLLQLRGQVVDEDVVFEEGIYDLNGLDWTPIAEFTEHHTMNGGDNVVIKGLTLSGSCDDCAGLVAVNNGSIWGINVLVDCGSQANAIYAGVIAGYNGINADINSCHVYGESEQPAELRATSDCMYMGGICGCNEGAVVYCTVRDVTFSAGANTTLGGATGRTEGTVLGCWVSHCAITGADDNSVLGGVTGELEGPDADIQAFCEQNTVLYCDISGQALAMGGVAGKMTNGYLAFNRVNFVTFSHPEGGKCAIGGLAGSLEGDINRLENSYYADINGSDMDCQSLDDVGGIVGYYSVSQTDEVFYKCYYCTDFCPFELYGDCAGDYADEQFCSCWGETKDNMTSPGWGAENLDDSYEGPWRNAGPDNYPVSTTDIPVSFSRLHRGDDYLPLACYRLLYNGIDVANIGMVGGDWEFEPEGFTVMNADPNDEMQIDVEYVTVNGVKLTDTIYAEDYGELCFSAVVDNAFCREILIPAVDEGNQAYSTGKGLYTADSLEDLRSYIDEAQLALDDAYLSIDPAWGMEMVNNIISAIMVLEELDFELFLNSPGATVYVDDSGEWVPCDMMMLVGQMGNEFTLKAEADDEHAFLFWQDSAGNILSENAEFTYTITRTTTITAVTAPKGSYTFTYKDIFGKTYKTEAVTDYSQVAYPVEAGQTGLRTGYKVSKWKNDYPGELPASGAVTRDVTFTASLQRTDDEYTVTTYLVTEDGTYEEETVTKKTAQVFRRTAPSSIGDYDFTCWRDANTKAVVSWSQELALSVYSDLTLEAVYEGLAYSKTCVNLWDPQINGSKIAFTGHVEYGSDFSEEISHGVLLLKSDDVPEDINFDTPGVINGVSFGYSALTKTYIINKTNVQPGDAWFGRAYLIYEDQEGFRKVLFTDIKGAEMPD